ncbi:radical SAM/SPASM domain-containing protein [Nocardiopsis sp. CC223A]|uniref:radical SAM/SPASM domain-containing protein n=1 Tax=Nocardiopsis sp. CC223A TaxID=3044051 RepID=UPI00278C4775|nr:radical SAM/SPASM domain-containing protein [Nocardiopsis sp. CC223A]
MTITEHSPTTTAPPVRMLWLDLTRKCQLECVHCYNESGPTGDHGTMTRAHWFTVVDQAATTEVEHIQLIGGEPTLHPDALAIARRALATGLHVEVYSNLVHVSDAWWELWAHPRASLATSYYSADPDRHNAMTGRPASHRHTRANIARAVERGVRLRVSIITPNGEGVEATRAELETLGVTHIGVDHVRLFGRGNPTEGTDVSGLCGACGDGRAAISPDGTVSPCVMSAWMGVGNTREAPLAGIPAGAPMAQARNVITAAKKDEPAPQPPPPNPIPCSPDQYCSPGTPRSECPPRN